MNRESKIFKDFKYQEKNLTVIDDYYKAFPFYLFKKAYASIYSMQS